MSEKSINFNPEMVRAVLEGRKTQTRRPVKPQPPVNFSWFGWVTSSTDKKHEGCACWDDGDLSIQEAHYAKPLCQIGDILWVRETWERLNCESCEGDFTGKCQGEPDKDDGCYMYRATHYITGDSRWKPSIHMPREAARIFLKVTDVRVERVQDITEEDIIAEGCPGEYLLGRNWFVPLWDDIYAHRRRSFSLNPWVFAYEFERVKP